MRQWCIVLISCLGVAGCQGLNPFKAKKENPTIEGERKNVFVELSGLKPEKHLQDLPEKQLDGSANPTWTHPRGGPRHCPSCTKVSEHLKLKWKTSIGSGNSPHGIILNEPIVANGTVYTLDARGQVSAVDSQTGQIKWQKDILPTDSKSKISLGGGIAYKDGNIYIGSPFAEIIVLQADNGDLLWRRNLAAPMRSAPTVTGKHVFALTINNQVECIDRESGETLWTHKTFHEAAGILGTASPAIQDNILVVPYSNGDVFGLRADTGDALWSQSLGSVSVINSLSTIAHVKAFPVIDGNTAYLVSHGDHTVALNLQDGDVQWSRDIGGIEAPAVGYNFIYLITNYNELVCLDKKKGGVKWIHPLTSLSEKSQIWSGPTLTSQGLFVTNSAGEILRIHPENGDKIDHIETGKDISIAPIVASETLYVLTSDGFLFAFN